MKYESEMLQNIHETALAEFKLGLITEEEMREYDEACLPENATNEDYEHEDINIKNAELVTA